MIGFLMKIIICPVTVYLSDLLFTSVSYANLTQIVIVGLLLAVSAHMMELFLLKENTFWTSNVLDFAAAGLIVYFSQFFLNGAFITFVGAILTALLLSVTEYFQHQYLIRTKKVVK